MIERFHHTVGSDTLVYERSFDCHNDIVYTPNDVAVIGKDEFYVTNVLSPVAPPPDFRITFMSRV